MQRRLEAELLDILPAADERAIDSRRDLERLNSWMRHAAIVAHLLHESLNGEGLQDIIELGAGDGKFMLSVAGRLARRWPGVSVRLLDRQDVFRADTRTAFGSLTWSAEAVTTDIFEGLEKVLATGCQVTVANLFLHHLTNGQLSELFNKIGSQAQLFIGLEPRRSPFALALSHCVRLIGCKEVTQHDAPVSVRAGFAGEELSQLWPDAEEWCLRESSIGLFSHLFLAQRRELLR